MEAETNRPLLVGVREAARILGLPANRAYEWCRLGLIPHVYDNCKIRVPRHALGRIAEQIESGEFVGPNEKPRA